MTSTAHAWLGRVLVILLLASFISIPAPLGAGYAAGSAPFINTWLVAGTFDHSGGNQFNNDYIGETTVQPVVGTVSNGKTWEYFDDRLFIRNLDDFQDLYSYYKLKKSTDPQYKIAYAHTYVYSPVARSVRLSVGTNDQFKAWVNGSLATTYTGTRLAKKDETSVNVTLNAGWNRVLLKLANLKWAWGFYARISDNSYNALTDLVYSVNGGAGALAVTTTNMNGTPNLPVGYKEWTYVAINVTENSGNTNNVQSSAFRLQAQGAGAPYTWSITSGSLPPGLTLASDGTITGTPTANGDYTFTVRATNSSSATATKSLTISVQDPPNKTFIEARINSLVHGPENITNYSSFVNQMKREGYQYVVPQCLNGEAPQWPGPAFPNMPDVITPIYNATTSNNLRFGCYFSVYNSDYTRPTGWDGNDWRMALLEDMINRYAPTVLWFDELQRIPGGTFGTALNNNREWDAMHSYLRARDPNTVVIMNTGTQQRWGLGDFDILEREGWNSNYWDNWPTVQAHEKKTTTDSWRFVAQNGSADWQTWIKVMVSMIGEGFTVGLDHTPNTFIVNEGYCSNCNVDQMHENIANWMTPPNLPLRYTSLVNTNPAPLNSGTWGYSTINLAQDKIYLHILSNPRGKTGLPTGNSLTVGPITANVSGVKLLNNNTSRSFTKSGTNLTIDIAGITADPVDTILEISLGTGTSPTATPTPTATAGPTATPTPTATPPSGGSTNLALNQPASASTTLSASYPASAANDGSLNTSNFGGWSPTASDPAAWWQVDLGSAYRLTSLELVTRQGIDQSDTRRNFEIRASNDPTFATYTVLASQGSTTLPYQSTFSANVSDTNSYRYIRVAKTVAEYFFITEFRVFGTTLPAGSNVALNQPASASTTLSASYPASAANDGSLNTSNFGGWSPTASDPAAWWQVDLGSAYRLTSLELVTRQGIDQSDTRRNFEIRASNDPTFATYTVLASQGSTTLPYQSTFSANVSDTNSYRYIRVAKTVAEYFFITEFRAFN
jgi:hypothetical protein